MKTDLNYRIQVNHSRFTAYSSFCLPFICELCLVPFAFKNIVRGCFAALFSLPSLVKDCFAVPFAFKNFARDRPFLEDYKERDVTCNLFCLMPYALRLMPYALGLRRFPFLIPGVKHQYDDEDKDQHRLEYHYKGFHDLVPENNA